jgi:hypothetical protein
MALAALLVLVRGSSEPRVEPPARHCRFRRGAAVSTALMLVAPGRARPAAQVARSLSSRMEGSPAYAHRRARRRPRPRPAQRGRDGRSVGARSRSRRGTRPENPLGRDHVQRVPLRSLAAGTSGKRHSRTCRRSASSAQPRELAAAPSSAGGLRRRRRESRDQPAPALPARARRRQAACRQRASRQRAGIE